MKIQKKTNISIGLLIILLGAINGYLFYKNNIQLEKKVISSNTWIEEPGLVAVESQEENKPLVSFYRISDGKEEKLFGNWKYNFFYQNEVAVYGTNLENQTKQILYFLSTRGGNSINISKLPGEITSVTKNTKGTYVLISGNISTTSTQESYTCVAERKDKIDPCFEIRKDLLKKEADPSAYYRAYWDKNDERKLAIREIGGKNRFFIFDPWETSPVLVTSTEKIERTSDIIDPKISVRLSENTFTRTGPIASFTNSKKNKGKIYVSIPSSSPIVLVSPRNFLFIKNNTFYILNTAEQTILELAPAPKNIKKISTIYGEYTLQK